LSLWREASRGKCRGVDFEWNPVELDRQLARAFASWRAWRLRRRDPSQESDDEDNPLGIFRTVTGQSLFRGIGELPEHDPLRAPMRRWVYRLAEQRINHDVLTRLTQERRLIRHPSDAPRQAGLSSEEMLKRSLTDAPRRDLWMRLFLECSRPVSEVTVELWQRRSEIARRLGLSTPASIESPAANVHELAVELAATLRDRVRELELRSPADYLEKALGQDIAGNWPGRLSPQRMLDFFRDGALLSSLDLRAPPLPEALGAASFCRALGILGAAWLEALAPTDQPFVIAHDPYGLQRHAAGALFSLLPLNARFLTRHLEVGTYAVADVQRRLAQLWLLELAVTAFRVQLRPYALGREQGFREAFHELGHRDLDLTLPREVTGALFSPGIEDEQHLAGLLMAAQRAEQLLETHDEDWFRNPRAIEQLRAEAHQPPVAHVAPEELAAALSVTTKRLQRLLR
jgi:hypothetical protein